MKEKWEYFDGDFIADQYNDTLLKYSPWSGHRRFGYDLVSYYEPGNLVELGSFYGCSSFAFMQAVKKNNLNTAIYPIDLWEANDKFTLHDYEQDVYGFFKEICTNEFSDINVKMMKMSFDEALCNFEDCSIDVLHIDGSHAYEDVKNDFDSWIAKVKSDGIILFHDVSEQLLYGKTLGSCIFWKELKKKYPFTVEMQHSWGLGILFLSEEKYRDFINKVDLDYYLRMNTYDETIAKDRIRTDYFKLLDADKWIKSLKADKESADQDNSRLLREIDTIQQNYKKTDDEKNAYVEELKNTLHDYEDTFTGKDRYIEELSATIEVYKQENLDIKAAYEQTIEAKDAYAEELKDTIHRYEDTFAGKDKYIEELLATIEAYKKEVQDVKTAYEQTIAGKDAYIVELESMKKIRR